MFVLRYPFHVILIAYITMLKEMKTSKKKKSFYFTFQNILLIIKNFKLIYLRFDIFGHRTVLFSSNTA